MVSDEYLLSIGKLISEKLQEVLTEEQIAQYKDYFCSVETDPAFVREELRLTAEHLRNSKRYGCGQ